MIYISQSLEKNKKNKYIDFDIKQSIPKVDIFASIIDENFYFFKKENKQTLLSESLQRSVLFFRNGANIESNNFEFITETINNELDSFTVDCVFKQRKNIVQQGQIRSHIFMLGEPDFDDIDSNQTALLKTGITITIGINGIFGLIKQYESDQIQTIESLPIVKNRWYYTSLTIIKPQNKMVVFVYDYITNTYIFSDVTNDTNNTISNFQFNVNSLINCMYNEDGYLSLFRIWNKSFSTNESILNAKNINITDNQSLICNINMDEGFGNDLYDKSGSSIDFKLKNKNRNQFLVDVDGNDLYLPEWKEDIINTNNVSFGQYGSGSLQ